MEAGARRSDQGCCSVNAYDELLRWCSEVRTGSVARLVAAARWSCRSIGEHRDERDVIADLQALGHVEVDWSSSRWQVAPTTLCRLDDSGGLWFLSGARPTSFDTEIEALESSSSPSAVEAYQALYLHDPIEQRGPSSQYAAFDDGPARREALASIGLRVVDAPSRAIFDRLSALSDITAFGVRRTVRPGELQGRMPFGVVTRGFPWETWPRDDVRGVYRYLRHGMRIFAIRRTDDWVEVDRETAIWWGADESQQPLLTRSPGGRCLYVRDLSRLPVLVERALVLRTGRLPTVLYDEAITGQRGPVRVFENVTGTEAEVVARLLRKRCEIR